MSHETFMQVLRLSGAALVVLFIAVVSTVVVTAVYGTVRSVLFRNRMVREAMRQERRKVDDLP